MMIWLVTKLALNDPQHKVYILGAHSSRTDALRHRKEVESPGQHTTHLIELDVDQRQAPILVGASLDGEASECQHNPPNG
ncbi:MAG: hypothetical protein AB7U82_35485 [Blastocatellales bacterium]